MRYLAYGFVPVYFFFLAGVSNSLAQTHQVAAQATTQTIQNEKNQNGIVTPPLPSLMSLAQALSLANSHHPDLLSYDANLLAQQAIIEEAQEDSHWEVDVVLTARTADLVNNRKQEFKDDSRAKLSISKLLWDFGRTSAAHEAATLGVKSAQIGAAYAVRIQRIQIMRQFFATLSADQQFAADNEALSLAFFPFDRARERLERFDSTSELEVLEKQSVYFAALSKRNQTISHQRMSRFRLALAMGRPQAKPDFLIEPDLKLYAREVPDFDLLLEQILAVHPLIKQQQAKIDTLNAKHGTVGSDARPELNFKVSAYEYVQDHRFRDSTRADIELEIPLFARKRLAAEQAVLDAQIVASEAQRLVLDYEVREQVLKWTQRLETLNQQIEQNVQNIEYTERALDKSRLLYEMEVKARIGQAQADMAKLQWQATALEFERALIWEKIDAVLGAPLVEFE